MALAPPPPSTPTTPNRHYTIAPPPTPRSSSANEIKARHHLQTTLSLTISSFSSLVADLTASYSSSTSLRATLSSAGRVTEQTRLDRIDQFREDWIIGALTRVPPPALLPEGQDETFSDGTRASLGGMTLSTLFDSDDDSFPSHARPRFIPFDPVERGNLAEKTIKSDLTRRRVLLEHKDHASLPRVATKAIAKVLRTGRAVYVAPGLLTSPSWVKDYEEHGWARPGVRWGAFRPDLVRFEEVKSAAKGEEGEQGRTVSWEVIEVKYQSPGSRDVIYANYKVQAIYYHLALTKLLSAVPNLIPSHRAVLWISQDPSSPSYIEKTLAIRTSLAFVEHHLFVLLPEWLHAVKTSEWKTYEERRERLRLAQIAQAPTPSLATPAPTFLDKLQATIPRQPLTPTPSSRLLPSRPLPRGPFPSSLLKPFRLPPLPDEDDLDLLESPSEEGGNTDADFLDAFAKLGVGL